MTIVKAYLILSLVSCLICIQITADSSPYADEEFLDNSGQFNEKEGVSLKSFSKLQSRSSRSSYTNSSRSDAVDKFKIVVSPDAATSVYADQIFLDNSDQYNESDGVSYRSFHYIPKTVKNKTKDYSFSEMANRNQTQGKSSDDKSK